LRRFGIPFCYMRRIDSLAGKTGLRPPFVALA
jgi:hypothetical protein